MLFHTLIIKSSLQFHSTAICDKSKKNKYFPLMHCAMDYPVDLQD